jgi:hypothetical protein
VSSLGSPRLFVSLSSHNDHNRGFTFSSQAEAKNKIFFLVFQKNTDRSVMGKSKLVRRLFDWFLFLFIISIPALSNAGSGITYHGKIIRPHGITPVTSITTVLGKAGIKLLVLKQSLLVTSGALYIYAGK